MPAIDADEIVPRIWVGGWSALETDLRSFDRVVLCAAEQNLPTKVSPAKVITAGFHDEDPISARSRATAIKTSGILAKRWHSGDRILVTCYAGMNRSALVAALTVLQICPTLTAADVIKRIRTRRRVPGHLQGHVAHALFNEAFVRVIEEAGRQRGLNVAL